MNRKQFDNVVKKLLIAKDNRGSSLNIHDLLIYEEDNNEFYHQFREQSKKSDVRSISKTVMTLLLGIVIEKSKQGMYPELSEETYIFPILKSLLTIDNHDNLTYLKKLKVKHLLTHTMGFDDVLMMRQDIVDIDPKDYLNKTLNHPIVHEPGTYYLYSNAGFYTLSVFLEQFIGEKLLDFAEREFFGKLNISDYEWEKYGEYCAGATRLWLYPHDLLKIATLFLKEGKYNGKDIVNPKWLNKMKEQSNLTAVEDKPNLTFRRYAYGYGIWLGNLPYYFGYGTDGQTMIILPDQRVIIITLANQVDIAPIEETISEILDLYKIV